jgi:hypothetical protein
VTREEMLALAERAKDEARRWRECPRHEFDPLPTGSGTLLLGMRVACKRCRVERRIMDVIDYVRGYAAAGGDPEDVLPGYRP